MKSGDGWLMVSAGRDPIAGLELKALRHVWLNECPAIPKAIVQNFGAEQFEPMRSMVLSMSKRYPLLVFMLVLGGVEHHYVAGEDVPRDLVQ